TAADPQWTAVAGRLPLPVVADDRALDVLDLVEDAVLGVELDPAAVHHRAARLVAGPGRPPDRPGQPVGVELHGDRQALQPGPNHPAELRRRRGPVVEGHVVLEAEDR